MQTYDRKSVGKSVGVGSRGFSGTGPRDGVKTGIVIFLSAVCLSVLAPGEAGARYQNVKDLDPWKRAQNLGSWQTGFLGCEVSSATDNRCMQGDAWQHRSGLQNIAPRYVDSRKLAVLPHRRYTCVVRARGFRPAIYGGPNALGLRPGTRAVQQGPYWVHRVTFGPFAQGTAPQTLSVTSERGGGRPPRGYYQVRCTSVAVAQPPRPPVTINQPRPGPCWQFEKIEKIPPAGSGASKRVGIYFDISDRRAQRYQLYHLYQRVRADNSKLVEKVWARVNLLPGPTGIPNRFCAGDDFIVVAKGETQAQAGIREHFFSVVQPGGGFFVKPLSGGPIGRIAPNSTFHPPALEMRYYFKAPNAGIDRIWFGFTLWTGTGSVTVKWHFRRFK